MEALESAPTTPLSRLDVLPPGERQRLLVEWNATEVEYPKEQCIHELFEAQAATAAGGGGGGVRETAAQRTGS